LLNRYSYLKKESIRLTRRENPTKLIPTVETFSGDFEEGFQQAAVEILKTIK
jgi:hypothetical protein